MSVLITGGTGALGSAVARKCVEIGIEPVLYDLAEDYTLISDIKHKVIFVKGDVLDLSKLVETLKTFGIKVMTHTVALLTKADPKISVRINTEGTVNVLWAAGECKTERIVYTSSKSVYNQTKGKHLHPVYRAP